MNRIGLVLNMVGIVILGLNEILKALHHSTLFWLTLPGWICLFIGFLLQFLVSGRSDIKENDNLGTKRFPNDKEYEHLTDHLDYLNDKIIDAFKLFIKLVTAITGGVFYLYFNEPNNLSKTYLVMMSDGLFIVVSLCMIFLIANNLYSWRKYRITLYNKYEGIPPITQHWCSSEIVMILIIVGLSILFICFNPLGKL